MAQAVARRPFPPQVLRQTQFWLRYFAEEWVSEVPLRIHTRSTDAGHGLGGPAFHHDFIVWLGQICFCPACIAGEKRRQRRNPDARLKTTKAFRRLRKQAPREFDALYLLVILHVPVEEIAERFNRDAERLGRPERYDTDGVVTLIVLGVEKVRSWWGT
jgi:hypothetical protein